MVGCEVPRETWMVVGWVSALNGKAGVALDDGDRDPSENQSVSDAEGVAEAAAKTAVDHFVTIPEILRRYEYRLVVEHRFLREHGRSPFRLERRMHAPVVERIRWWGQVSFLQSLLVVQEGKGP